MSGGEGRMHHKYGVTIELRVMESVVGTFKVPGFDSTSVAASRPAECSSWSLHIRGSWRPATVEKDVSVGTRRIFMRTLVTTAVSSVIFGSLVTPVTAGYIDPTLEKNAAML